MDMDWRQGGFSLREIASVVPKAATALCSGDEPFLLNKRTIRVSHAPEKR